MITVIEDNDGYSIAVSGQTVARDLTNAQAHELHAALGQTLSPVSTGLSPAKAMARMRRTKPPILRHVAKRRI